MVRYSSAIALLLGCGPARSPTPPPEALVLRIDRVDVSPTRAGTRESWDEAAAPADAAAGCKVVAAGATFFEPAVGGILSALCGLGGAPPRGRIATEPDLQVSLGAGPSCRYSTFAAADSSRLSPQYEFVVPVAAIPADGLRLEVLDEDKEGPELIGSIRLMTDELMAAYESPSKLLVLSAGSIERLEVVVSPYFAHATSTTTREAKAPPFSFERSVKAGEVVSVRARGSFRVGSYYDDTLSPAGYPGGEARRYNLGPFEKEPHGAAVALIGSRPTIDGVAIGRGRDFVAAHGGPLHLGLNDEDLDNNEGTVSFQVAFRAPTVREWLKGGEAR